MDCLIFFLNLLLHPEATVQGADRRAPEAEAEAAADAAAEEAAAAAEALAAAAAAAELPAAEAAADAAAALAEAAAPTAEAAAVMLLLDAAAAAALAALAELEAAAAAAFAPDHRRGRDRYAMYRYYTPTAADSGTNLVHHINLKQCFVQKQDSLFTAFPIKLFPVQTYVRVRAWCRIKAQRNLSCHNGLKPIPL